MGQMGGRRPGAGRPKGSKNKKPKPGGLGAPDPEIVAQGAKQPIAPDEVLPRRVLLDVMRFHYATAATFQRQLGTTADEGERGRILQRVTSALDRAATAARWAAPYCHPRLTAIEVSPGGGVGGGGAGGGGGVPERRRVTFTFMGRMVDEALRDTDSADPLGGGDDDNPGYSNGGNGRATIEHDAAEFSGGGPSNTDAGT
jgi:hypothetical protein